MDQLHDLRCSEDRSLLVFRRQIRSHPAARRSGAFYYLSRPTTIPRPRPAPPPTPLSVEPNGYKFTVARLNNGACAGSEDFISFLIDYRPVKRVDLYAGVMISNVYGGLANGFQATQTINPTAGLRIKF